MSVQKLSVVPTDYNGMIINSNEYNGRVNIMDAPSTNVVFQMQERIGIKNKATEYREALTGIWETNVLSQVFFSAENIQIIQNGLRAGVYQMSHNQFMIPPQNIDNLKIIMRSIYLQYAEHYPDKIREQVERLNKMVLEYAVPSVYNEAVGYMKYREDQSRLVVPLEKPLPPDRVYKQLQLKRWV